MNLQPKAVTALLVGLKSRVTVFREQRAINTYRAEPLMAILPGVSLQELWSLVSVAEMALMIVSVIVVIAGLMYLLSVLLAGLNERRREMAVLRSVGARPAHVFLLLCIESIVKHCCSRAGSRCPASLAGVSKVGCRWAFAKAMYHYS
jgi:putative ABC transport system permease protein